jgi:hypothetical protein
MEALYNREFYGDPYADSINCMGRIAISIANRWFLGWKKTAGDMLVAQTYLEALHDQRELERTC